MSCATQRKTVSAMVARLLALGHDVESGDARKRPGFDGFVGEAKMLIIKTQLLIE